MDPSTAALIGGVVGSALGGSSVLAWRFSEREQERVPEVAQPRVPPGVANVLSVLRSSAFVVGPEDQILQASAPARMMGLVNGNRVAVPELLEWVRDVRRHGQIREEELVIEVVRAQPRYVAARVAPLSSRLVLVLVEDQTSERRADTIRRDFVANVSHELKTPVGALNVLAEAVNEAAEDPEAVRRFAARMQTESERLTRLVRQIIELSRLQGDDPLEHAAPVPVSVITERAIDRVGVDASGHGVTVSFAGESNLRVVGDEDQLVVALGNLVENAVGYSPPGTRVTLSARRNGDLVEIAVTDRGVGIPTTDLDRIFERFYRVDPARARATGGTGLGLSIVKHVAATHGGDVRVWSVEGQGSTFTLALPAYDGEPAARAAESPPTDPDTVPALAASSSASASAGEA